MAIVIIIKLLSGSLITLSGFHFNCNVNLSRKLVTHKLYLGTNATLLPNYTNYTNYNPNPNIKLAFIAFLIVVGYFLQTLFSKMLIVAKEKKLLVKKSPE